MAVRFFVGTNEHRPAQDYLQQLEESGRSVERIDSRRDDEAFAQRRYLTGRLARIPQGVDDVRRIELLLSIAQQIYQTGHQLVRAVEPVAHAVHLARQTGDSGLVRKALTTQGVILIGLDNLDHALQCFDEATRLEPSSNDPQTNFALVANIGTALFQTFIIDDARRAFLAVDSLARTQADGATRAGVLANSAACEWEMGEVEAAINAARDSARLLRAPTTPEQCAWRAMAEATLVCALLQSDRVGEARERDVFARHFAARSASRRAELAADGAAGLCEIAAGAAASGRARVLEALALARAIPLSLRGGLLMAVQASEMAGDHASALAYQREFGLLIARQKAANAALHATSSLGAGEAIVALAEQRQARRCSQLRGAYVDAMPNDGCEAFLREQALANECAAGEGDKWHADRVSALAGALARALNLDETTASHIELGARWHDVGMNALPRSLLAESRMLADHERALMQHHCNDGADLIARSDLPYRRVAEDIARHHHERWDGAGYPAGLRGDDIPLAARIVALADAFDSMTRVASYRSSLDTRTSLSELTRELGTQFDPHIGRVFIAMITELQSR